MQHPMKVFIRHIYTLQIHSQVLKKCLYFEKDLSDGKLE